MPWATATQTASIDNLPRVDGFSPKPTSIGAVELFRKDQPVAETICGYVEGSIASPISCSNGNACFLKSDWAAVGCCQSSSWAGSYWVVDQCTHYTDCYESASISNCNGTCQKNTRIAKCSNPAAPYCHSFTYTNYDINTYNYFFYGCTSQPSVTGTLGYTYKGEYASAAPTYVLASSNSTGPAPNDKSSDESASNTGAIVGGVVGGLLFVLAVGGAFLMYYCLRKRSREQESAHMQAIHQSQLESGRYQQQQQQQQQAFDRPDSMNLNQQNKTVSWPTSPPRSPPSPMSPPPTYQNQPLDPTGPHPGQEQTSAASRFTEPYELSRMPSR
ncbi:MAG: hypothetical protein M1834_002427 [Cirrosporium novae-zelandiae]|nr:MAG: hypothetical protein M1834_002427 [Cirrosporium novae-zelandiae]